MRIYIYEREHFSRIRNISVYDDKNMGCKMCAIRKGIRRRVSQLHAAACIAQILSTYALLYMHIAYIQNKYAHPHAQICVCGVLYTMLYF